MQKMTSKYTDRKISPAQYLAERICERIAKKEKKTLAHKFWNTDYWKPIFMMQVVKANELLDYYNFAEIVKALAKPRASYIYSLGAKAQLGPFLEEARKELALSENVDIVIEVDEESISQQPQKTFKKNNLIGELD